MQMLLVLHVKQHQTRAAGSCRSVWDVAEASLLLQHRLRGARLVAMEGLTSLWWHMCGQL
jgi:hypothetical protein